MPLPRISTFFHGSAARAYSSLKNLSDVHANSLNRGAGLGICSDRRPDLRLVSRAREIRMVGARARRRRFDRVRAVPFTYSPAFLR